MLRRRRRRRLRQEARSIHVLRRRHRRSEPLSPRRPTRAPVTGPSSRPAPDVLVHLAEPVQRHARLLGRDRRSLPGAPRADAPPCRGATGLCGPYLGRGDERPWLLRRIARRPYRHDRRRPAACAAEDERGARSTTTACSERSRTRSVWAISRVPASRGTERSTGSSAAYRDCCRRAAQTALVVLGVLARMRTGCSRSSASQRVPSLPRSRTREHN